MIMANSASIQIQREYRAHLHRQQYKADLVALLQSPPDHEPYQDNRHRLRRLTRIDRRDRDRPHPERRRCLSQFAFEERAGQRLYHTFHAPRTGLISALEHEIRRLQQLDLTPQIQQYSDRNLILISAVQGPNLYSAAAHAQRYSERWVRNVMLAILSDLRKVHDLGIVCGHLFPSTIAFGRDPVGGVEWPDMVSGAISVQVASRIQLSQYLPYRQQIRLTFEAHDFLAPEIKTGGRYRPETDLYSAGMILNLLLTGTTSVAEPSPASEAAMGLVAALLHSSPTSRPTAAQAMQHHWFTGESIMIGNPMGQHRRCSGAMTERNPILDQMNDIEKTIELGSGSPGHQQGIKQHQDENIGNETDRNDVNDEGQRTDGNGNRISENIGEMAHCGGTIFGGDCFDDIEKREYDPANDEQDTVVRGSTISQQYQSELQSNGERATDPAAPQTVHVDDLIGQGTPQTIAVDDIGEGERSTIISSESILPLVQEMTVPETAAPTESVQTITEILTDSHEIVEIVPEQQVANDDELDISKWGDVQTRFCRFATLKRQEDQITRRHEPMTLSTALAGLIAPESCPGFVEKTGTARDYVDREMGEVLRHGLEHIATLYMANGQLQDPLWELANYIKSTRTPISR